MQLIEKPSRGGYDLEVQAHHEPAEKQGEILAALWSLTGELLDRGERCLDHFGGGLGEAFRESGGDFVDQPLKASLPFESGVDELLRAAAKPFSDGLQEFRDLGEYPRDLARGAELREIDEVFEIAQSLQDEIRDHLRVGGKPADLLKALAQITEEAPRVEPPQVQSRRGIIRAECDVEVRVKFLGIQGQKSVERTRHEPTPRDSTRWGEDNLMVRSDLHGPA